MKRPDSPKIQITIVADTGDIDATAKLKPRDSTTNPSLLVKVSSQPQYPALVDEALKYAGGRRPKAHPHLRAVESIQHRPTTPEFSGDIIPIQDIQRRYATRALAQMGRHTDKAAEKLGIDAKTLWKWLGNDGLY